MFAKNRVPVSSGIIPNVECISDTAHFYGWLYAPICALAACTVTKFSVERVRNATRGVQLVFVQATSCALHRKNDLGVNQKISLL